MYCSNCGEVVGNNQATCVKCGAHLAEIGKNLKIKVGLIVMVCTLIGYLAGREHTKYELRSESQNNVFDDNSTKFSVSSESVKNEKAPEPIQFSLLKKGFSDREYGGAIIFKMLVENKTDKNIRAFDGVLSFMDLLDNEIYSAPLAINDPLSSYGVS